MKSEFIFNKGYLKLIFFFYLLARIWNKHQLLFCMKQSLTAEELPEETLKGRFRSGVGNSLEVTDARAVLFNAQNLFIQSLYDYQVGYVGLQRATGTLK